MEKPLGIIRAGSSRLHLLTAASARGSPGSSASGAKAGAGSGCEWWFWCWQWCDQGHHWQRVREVAAGSVCPSGKGGGGEALMTVTGAPPWFGATVHLFHHPAMADACHFQMLHPQWSAHVKATAYLVVLLFDLFAYRDIYIYGNT